MRIAIVVVAYNAEATLVSTLDRIPAEFLAEVDELIICDDASFDDTFGHARAWANRPGAPKAHVIRHTKNLGYGGNQKAAYQLAIDHGMDVVVLLHGDGQYAPEVLPEMVAPFREGGWAAVFGSRMLVKGSARRGGMPLYKLLGNKILTRFENTVLGSDLSEFHSGYRAYSTEALRRIPFASNSDGFDFDTQIIAQILGVGGRIREIPIPTYYGDEVCYVNGLAYAKDVVRDVVEFKLSSLGFGDPEWVPPAQGYAFKDDDRSSHSTILGMLAEQPPSRILDLGCSGGLLAERLRQRGHHVVGVDAEAVPGVHERTDGFFEADLSAGLPEGVGGGYDVVIAGDVIEHLPRPLDLLHEARAALRPGGQLLLSVPNFTHWYPRVRLLTGSFGYDRRGILDVTHMRFFSRRSLRRTVEAAGFDVLEEQATGLPLGAVTEGEGRLVRGVRAVDRWLVRGRPNLFAYQYVLRLAPHAGDMIFAEPLEEDADVAQVLS